MDNREIECRKLAQQIAAELHGRPVQLLILALVQYALELTIMARSHFVDDKPELAKHCNESVHRILGYIGTELRSEAPPGQRDSMIDMVVENASQKGWLNILRIALERSTRSA